MVIIITAPYYRREMPLYCNQCSIMLVTTAAAEAFVRLVKGKGVVQLVLCSERILPYQFSFV